MNKLNIDDLLNLVRSYNPDEVEIIKTQPGSTGGFQICVTDKVLLEKTGGIIQGMSGSPLIQNGKMIGAVTHVFVNDPTKGYAIYAEDMLNH